MDLIPSILSISFFTLLPDSFRPVSYPHTWFWTSWGVMESWRGSVSADKASLIASHSRSSDRGVCGCDCIFLSKTGQQSTAFRNHLSLSLSFSHSRTHWMLHRAHSLSPVNDPPHTSSVLCLKHTHLQNHICLTGMRSWLLMQSLAPSWMANRRQNSWWVIFQLL